MEKFEKAAKSKGLHMAAKNLDWEKAKALVDELGPQSWRERSLMGDSPEWAAYDECARLGVEPSWSMLESLGAKTHEIDQLEKRAIERWESMAPKSKEIAARWMLSCAPKQPWSGCFSEISSKDDAVAEGWGAELLNRLGKGSLDASWSQHPGFWRMCSKASPKMTVKIGQALHAAAMGSIGSASKNGAMGLASAWIDRLDPEQALLVLALAHCSSMNDWHQFEQTCGEAGGVLGSELKTRDLSSMVAEAARPGSTGSQSEFIAIYQQGELASPRYGSGDAKSWGKAMRKMASRAAMALSSAGEGAPELSNWLSERMDPKLVAVAMPERAANLDFSNLSGQQVIDALIQLHKSGDVDALARAGSLAAQRLWDLNQRLESLGLDRPRHGGIDDAALALWRAQDARGFEGFLVKLRELSGSAGIASSLCGIPSPALNYDGGFKEPGCAGQVIALLRVVDPSSLDGSGSLVWGQEGQRSDPLSALLAKAEAAAHLDLLDAGALEAWDFEAPAEMGPRETWGSLHLSKEPWAKSTTPAMAVEGWESAFEAIERFRLELTHAQPSRFESGVPPKPGMDKGSPSARNAWNVFATGHAKLAADWLCQQWMGTLGQSEMADKLCSSMGAQAREAIAQRMPEAFEEKMESWSKGKMQLRVVASCQAAAKALGEDGPSTPSVQEALCAACMCASAYGLAKSYRPEQSGYYGSRDARTSSRLAEQAKELDGYLPQACSALSMSGWGESGPFGKKELCGKGFWGALCMKATSSDIASKGWAQEWADAGLSAQSEHAQASLRGLFEIPPSEHANDERWMQLLAEAQACLSAAGVEGWHRLSGEHSALEMAVDCRAMSSGAVGRADRGCFGEGVVKKLIEMGARASDDQAPKGRDALALCASVERKQSPSSVMKALLRSPSANPSQGALLSILAKGKSTLSEKLVDELSGKALARPCMDALVRLGLCCPDARPGLWLANALKSEGGKVLAPDLLAALARGGADAKSCASVAMCMQQRRLSPSLESQRSMDLGAFGELLKSDSWNFSQNISNWMQAGAKPGAVRLDALPGLVAQSCARSGCVDSASLPQAALAMALDHWSAAKPSGGLGARLLSVVCSLPEEWMGPSELQSVGFFMSEIESRGKAEALRAAVEDSDLAKLESWAISAVAGSAGPKAPRQRL